MTSEQWNGLRAMTSRGSFSQCASLKGVATLELYTDCFRWSCDDVSVLLYKDTDITPHLSHLRYMYNEYIKEDSPI